MRVKLLIAVAAVVLLCGCSRQLNPTQGGAEIDWVDFVKLNGHSYTGQWEFVLKNPSDVADQVVGEVKFKVANVVTNPGYRTKDGDAAFLAEGTKLYRVSGYKENELIAAKDEERIGGYRLYVEDSFRDTMPRYYKDVPKDKVERVELYHSGEVKPYKTLYNRDKQRFIELLESGKDTSNYSPKNKSGDPVYYQMVFYTDAPIALAFSLADDRTHVFFSPWDTRLVPYEIRELIQD